MPPEALGLNAPGLTVYKKVPEMLVSKWISRDQSG